MAKEEVQEGTGVNAAKLKALQATIDKIERSEERRVGKECGS